MTDREKLICLQKTNCKIGKKCPGECIGCMADHLIANGVTVQQWIPVSEPPEVWRDENGYMVNYFVYMPEYGVDIGNYMRPAKCWVCMGIPCKVTHWMPLPQPPKEDDHGSTDI